MSLFHLPGFYWFLEDEAYDETMLNEITAYCERVMYSNFRILGYHEFKTEVLRLITKQEGYNYDPILKYFYNRQLLIQMTSKPIETSETYVSIPLKREPGYELQMDILALQSYYREVNYNIRYLVVIIDTYTRFVWCAPVGQLTVPKVLSAIAHAFSRPGIASQFFHFLRELVANITVDGGSEFKKDFPETMTSLFPNSSVHVSLPKNVTFNRPTTTGPIESAIRMLRKLLRDYALQKQTDILGSHSKEDSLTYKMENQHGLSAILDSFNSMKRAVLDNGSPITVANDMMNGHQEHQEMVESLTKQMAEKRQKQFKKKKDMQTKQFPIITSRNQQYGYRLFIPPSAFPKEVDFRMSLELYYIDEYNTSKLILRNWDTNELKPATWQQLILVKAPVTKGPEQIQRHIKQLEKVWEFKKPSPKEMVTPYHITPTIANAIDPNEELPHPGNQPVRVQPKRQKRFQGDYKE
jgi:hypothetical protein